MGQKVGRLFGGGLLFLNDFLVVSWKVRTEDIMPERQKVDPENAPPTRGDYAGILKKIVDEGHCPFCEEHLYKHHTEKVLWKGAHWLATKNFRPYKGAVHHFLVISLHHVRRISELPQGAGDELVTLHSWLAETYKLPGSTIIWREGDTEMTGATVDHLHCQVVIGEKRSSSTDFLRTAIGFKQKE
jgi:diadenosine tetraphosphate (Ap4A) HIT family hydrolase